MTDIKRRLETYLGIRIGTSPSMNSELATIPTRRARKPRMSIWRIFVLSTGAFFLSTIAGHAGPCSDEIDRMQARIDAKLEAKAMAGPTAPESSAALRSRQPTPRSIAAAESKLREVSPETVKVIKQAMLRARKADRVGNREACQRALAKVQTAIGQ